MSEGHYGRHGTLGVATPQANPDSGNRVSERFCQKAWPARRCAWSVPSATPRPGCGRTLSTLPRPSIASTRWPMRAIGLACTGSSYLLGHEFVEASLADLSARRGQPVVSAAAAIERALAQINARSIALICPYPQWLLAAAEAHWRGARVPGRGSFLSGTESGRYPGDLCAFARARAAEQIKSRWQNREADAYLITGTGLPTLQIVADLAPVLRRAGVVLESLPCLGDIGGGRGRSGGAWPHFRRCRCWRGGSSASAGCSVTAAAAATGPSVEFPRRSTD